MSFGTDMRAAAQDILAGDDPLFTDTISLIVQRWSRADEQSEPTPLPEERVDGIHAVAEGPSQFKIGDTMMTAKRVFIADASLDASNNLAIHLEGLVTREPTGDDFVVLNGRWLPIIEVEPIRAQDVRIGFNLYCGDQTWQNGRSIPSSS